MALGARRSLTAGVPECGDHAILGGCAVQHPSSVATLRAAPGPEGRSAEATLEGRTSLVIQDLGASRIVIVIVAAGVAMAVPQAPEPGSSDFATFEIG